MRPPSSPSPVPRPSLTGIERECLRRHWRRSVAWMCGLLTVWAGVSLGCGIVLAETLNQWHLGGFPLGFWFAQQGSILTFLLLVLIYALVMNRLDARHRIELAEARGREASAGGTP